MGSWYETQSKVMAKAKEGVRLSQLTGAYLTVANSLIKRGKLQAIPLPDGDWLINTP